MSAVSTLQHLLARQKSAMDAVRTLWERRADAASGKHYNLLFSHTTRRPHNALAYFLNAVQTPFGVTGA